MSSHQDPFSTPDAMPPFGDLWAVRRKIASQLRSLNEQLLTRDASLEALQQLSSLLDSTLPFAEHATSLAGRLLWADKPEHGGYDLLSRELTPLAGHSNMLAPPLHMWLDRTAGTAHARISLGWAYEGPPQCVHGGWIAALFDEFFGCAQLLSGKVGATGTLDVRYLRPTPLHVELDMFAQVTAVHGRKIKVEGTMSANGVVTARCEGLFICIADGVANLAQQEKAVV